LFYDKETNGGVFFFIKDAHKNIYYKYPEKLMTSDLDINMKPVANFTNQFVHNRQLPYRRSRETPQVALEGLVYLNSDMLRKRKLQNQVKIKKGEEVKPLLVVLYRD
jgi:hypothetical protein